MSTHSAVLALISYPLLVNLPPNVVRFRWGFRRGLAPMPPDVELQAEAADRAALFVIHLVLLAVIIFLLQRSSISAYAMGLTTENWKSGIAVGGLLGCVNASVGAVLLRSVAAPGKLQEIPESRGPLATWSGLTVLGSLSVEFWRVFCIVTLIRFDFSAWLAVMVVAVAYGSASLTTSTAKALGAACFGGVAGFSFVKTGSLLAPVVMSLITTGTYVYRARHVSLRKRADPARSAVTCPVCKAAFDLTKVKRTLTAFTCPECGEQLQYETGWFDSVWFAVSFFGVPIAVYLLGFRDLSLVWVSAGSAICVFALGIAIHSRLRPPKLELRSADLSLINRPKFPK